MNLTSSSYILPRNTELLAIKTITSLNNSNTNHSYSLYGLSQSLQEHRDDIGMGCCYGSQQLPPYFWVDFSGRHTHIRHLMQNKKRVVKQCRHDTVCLLSRGPGKWIFNQCYSVHPSNFQLCWTMDQMLHCGWKRINYFPCVFHIEHPWHKQEIHHPHSKNRLVMFVKCFLHSHPLLQYFN